MNKKEFSIKDTGVEGEYWGNRDSKKVVIFSHGFGVKRDSRGMFVELARLLEGDYLVVLFDFVTIDDQGNTNVYAFSEQSKKLKSVIGFVKETFVPEEVNIVAHSQGCVITGITFSEVVDKAILLAGPITPFALKMKEHFSNREGTEINEQGVSTLKRSDGKLTFVHSDFWDEAKNVDPSRLYLRLLDVSDVYFIRALQDRLVVDEDYSLIQSDQRMNLIELDGSHDFEGENRDPLLNKVVKILNE